MRNDCCPFDHSLMTHASFVTDTERGAGHARKTEMSPALWECVWSGCLPESHRPSKVWLSALLTRGFDLSGSLLLGVGSASPAAGPEDM